MSNDGAHERTAADSARQQSDVARVVLTTSDWLAAASDRGRHHPTNQDAVAIAAVPREDRRALGILVVSDGVSSSRGAEGASQRAVYRAASSLNEQARETADLGVDGRAEALVQAFRQARTAVLHPERGEPAGSCTLIAAVVDDELIEVANLGDSRAYWIGDDGVVGRLSIDDSVAQEEIARGVSPEEAEHGYLAHTITRWLGPGFGDPTPRITGLRSPGPGWLLLCTDGLWNDASDAGAMGALVQELSHGDALAPVDLALALVGWANEQGGFDNITVALARVK